MSRKKRKPAKPGIPAAVKNAGAPVNDAKMPAAGRHPVITAGVLPAYLPGIILFFIALTVGLLIYKDYGVSWDEPVSRRNGVMSFEYVFHDQQDLFSYKDRNYGVGFELPLLMLEKLLKLTDTRGIYLMRHLVTHVFFLSAVFALYILVYRLFKNRFLACLAFLMLVLTPRLYAHSFFNSKDLAFLSAYVITLAYCQFAFEKNKTLHYVVLAVLCSYTTSIRIMAVMLCGFILFFLLADLAGCLKDKEKRNKSLLNIFLFSISFCVSLYVFWPYLWSNPVHNFIESYNSFSRFPWAGTILFNGVFIPATNLPWTYFPVWFLISNPVLWLATGFGGIGLIAWAGIKQPFSFLTNTPRRNFLLYMLCFGVPILAVIRLNSVIYDDWRHLYFVYPAFILMGLYFINQMLRFFPRYRIAIQSICLLQAGLTGYFMISEHPFQQVYFNELVSHGHESLRKNYDMDYWGLSFKQALEHLVAGNKYGTIKVNSGRYTAPLNNNIMLLPEKDRQRIQVDNDISDADYFITNFRWHPDNFTYQPEFSIEALNSTILCVYKPDKNSSLNIARRYVQSKQYDSAIAYFNKVPANDPNMLLDAGDVNVNYLNAQFEISNIFLIKGLYDSAELHYKLLLFLMPAQTDALFNLGVVYFNTKRYPEAIQLGNRLIAADPNYIKAYSIIGRSYFNMKQYREAIDVFSRELAARPGLNNDYPFISASYQLLGKTDSAKIFEGVHP